MIEVIRSPDIPAAMEGVFASGDPARTETVIPGPVTREIAGDIAPIEGESRYAVLALTELTEMRWIK